MDFRFYTLDIRILWCCANLESESFDIGFVILEKSSVDGLVQNDNYSSKFKLNLHVNCLKNNMLLINIIWLNGLTYTIIVHNFRNDDQWTLYMHKQLFLKLAHIFCFQIQWILRFTCEFLITRFLVNTLRKLMHKNKTILIRISLNVIENKNIDFFCSILF